MKKIKLTGKLNLNKSKIAELNTNSIKGGAPKSDRIECGISKVKKCEITLAIDCYLTGYNPGCKTYPCCKSLEC